MTPSTYKDMNILVLKKTVIFLFAPIIENGEEQCIRGVLFFSTQNQLPQIIIGHG